MRLLLQHALIVDWSGSGNPKGDIVTTVPSHLRNSLRAIAARTVSQADGVSSIVCRVLPQEPSETHRVELKKEAGTICPVVTRLGGCSNEVQDSYEQNRMREFSFSKARMAGLQYVSR